ncbi:glycosyltransferase family 39 protein [Patescibacteria group bacterium]|nr:glycosyltransferase family 39 protein [Patescibacteria group bacterium]
MKIKKFIIHNSLFIILFLAAILRLWSLGSNPPHLTPDEAALGYNAYSILKTGRDEYGELLPVIFKSFGDYKPGLYIYLTVPFVALFGLTEFAVRLPSAIAGVTAVWLLYLIVKELFKEKKLVIDYQPLAIIASFLLAISPWNIYFSRGAWEVNVSLALTLGGIYFLLKALKKEKYLILSALLFAATLITYQGAKLATVIVFAILIVLYWKKIFGFSRKILLASFVVGLIISFPIILSLFQGKTGRLRVFSVFSYPRPEEYTQSFLDQGKEKFGSFTYYLFHSETLNFKRGILGRWFNHFSGRFLFFEGDWQNPRHSAPNQGVLVHLDLILLIAGFVALVKYGLKKETAFIWLWLVLAPLPAALSRDQVHAVRSYNLVIPLTILLSFGAVLILNKLNRFKWVFVSVYILGYIYFLDSLFVHLPVHDSKLWEYGYKQIVETVAPIQDNYETVKVQQSFAQPYIYFLFFQRYDPAKYQKQARLVESEYKGDVGYVEKLDNICFCPIDWSVNRGESGTLFVADTIRIPPEDSSDETLFKLIKEIKYLNGNTAFRVLEVK